MSKFLLILLLFFYTSLSVAQELRTDRSYFAHGSELILGFNNDQNESVKYRPRLSGFLNWQSVLNLDMNKYLGIYLGLAIRNIGITYIKDDITFGKEAKFKQRAYTLGLPVAFKIGNNNRKKFLFFGAEMEYAFAYKQKVYFNNHKDVYSSFISKQVIPWQPSLFAGIQGKRGLNIKFKYYLKNLLNTQYTITDERGEKPFLNLRSQIMYISLSIMMRKKKTNKVKLPETKENELHTRL